MKNTIKRIVVITAMLLMVLGIMGKPVKAMAAGTDTAIVAETNENDVTSAKSYAAAITLAVAAGLGALAMGLVIAKAVDGIARQPEAEGKIRTTMMLGLVFVETAIIYALIVAILIIFVL